MRKLHPAAKVPLVALAAALVTFPILSIQGDGPHATITLRSLWLGLGVLVAGYVLLLLRTGYRAAKPQLDAARKEVTATLWSGPTRWATLAPILLLAVLWPFIMPRQFVNLGFETLIYITLALGLNVVVGYAGLLVLGYAAFWAIGSYTFAICALRFGLSMWVCFPLAGVAALLAGLLLGLPSLRLRGDYLAIVTLGFGEAVYYFLKTQVELTGGEMGLPNKDIRGDLQDHTSIFGSGPLIEPNQYYWPALLLVALAVFFIWRVERSRVGRALVAMREDETAARCMGINTTKLKLAAFAFSAMWAGFAGVLWTAKLNYTNPMYFYFMQSVMVLAMVVLGGMGSIPGAIVGAILLYAGPALLRMYSQQIQEDLGLPDPQKYRLLIFGAVMVILMVYRPQGLFGSARLKIRPDEEESG